MSAFLPRSPRTAPHDPDFPRLQERPRTPAEQRARWEVRAAQWRAREIAELIFGEVSEASLSGLRAAGPIRGLLRLEVPFADLESHREREELFIAAARGDPVLSHVPLLFVFGASVPGSHSGLEGRPGRDAARARPVP